MIEPKPGDIGRRVVYRDPGAGKIEEGELVAFNREFAFVRYGAPGTGSQATKPADLEWSDAATT